MKLKIERKMLSLRQTIERMNTQVVRQTLHEIIDQIQDDEVLTLYLQLLERELRNSTTKDIFDATDDDLVARAKASLASIEAGNTRNIKDFKKDVEAWKKQRAM